ncbi:MAG: VWA domain-containing protein, partial [Planctomycetales bacterium]|nr:VWA domain-containing protein [Planctomycetales bacterium]
MRNDRILATLLTAIAIFSACSASPSEAAETSRLITYQRDGRTYYALSLMPEVQQAQADSTAIVVLMDTSASQQGAYRESAMAALESLLTNLRPGDQVELLGVDLDVKAMTEGFVAPDSAELEAAVDRLREQVPLGSTDLEIALQDAADRLAFADAEQRTVVYIGDGVSKANLLDTSTLADVVGKLRESRVSVTSLAVGPRVDAQLLAVLANHTGGNLYVQPEMVWQDDQAGISDERAQEENLRNAQVAGKHLADWTRATVFWPRKVNFATELGQTFPAVVPPLRTDRDTIILGSTTDELPAAIDVNLDAEAYSGGVQLSWTAEPEASQDDHAFLTQVIDIAESDAGMSLPTVGSAGLMETARLVGAQMDQLTRLAERAVSAGDREAAQRIAQNVLRADPGNAQARTVQHVAEELVAEELAPAGQVGEVVVEEQAVPLEGDISLVQPDSVTVVEPVEEGLLGNFPRDGEFLDQVEQERRVYAEMLSKSVQNEIVDARTEMASNPQLAIQNLKLALESVSRAADLDAAKRAELTDKLRNVLKEAHYQASLKDELDRQREEALASVRERKLLNERLNRDQEREKQLMARFSSLMDERRYLEAEEVAQVVEEIDPDGVIPRVATLVARQARHVHLQQVARAARWQGYFDSMYQIELSHIPFPDDPPILYPEAEIWQDLTNRRKKYDSVDLSASSKAEERIQTALREPLKAPLEFVDQPLVDVVAQLVEEYQIPIQFDNSALNEVAISTDTEVNASLSNISLRSALNLMLKAEGLEGLTYVIDEEVLLITTEDRANETLTTKVYPVADLVLPIQNLGIVGGGGGGGLGGGGGGGGGVVDVAGGVGGEA